MFILKLFNAQDTAFKQKIKMITNNEIFNLLRSQLHILCQVFRLFVDSLGQGAPLNKIYINMNRILQHVSNKLRHFKMVFPEHRILKDQVEGNNSSRLIVTFSIALNLFTSSREQNWDIK